MFIKFRNAEKLSSSTPPVETKLFDSAKNETGWLFSAVVTIPPDSPYSDGDGVDRLLAPENISEITLCGDDGTVKKVISGYRKVQSVNIGYAGDLSVSVEMQFTKWHTDGQE